MKLFDRVMDNSAFILFCASLLLFVGGFAFGLWQQRPEMSFEEEPVLRFNEFLLALMQAANNAVWPFVGAGLIWTLKKRDAESAE